MKKFIILIICFVLFLGACSDDNLEENSVSEPFLPSESNYSVSSESSVTENIESSSEPNIPISELTETNNIPGNSTFVKVEISACLKLNCYALTDSGNLYCFDYMDQSLECIRSGVIDFWEGSFYPEPNIIFENGWIFINEKYYYKPDFISVAGDFFIRSDGKIEYLKNGNWEVLETEAKIIKATRPDEIRFTDKNNNLYLFSKYHESPVLLAENVADYAWNYFDKVNYADETICIKEDGNIEIIFDKEFSDPETFLSHIPNTAKRVYSSSGNFLFQKEDGTYIFGHKKQDISRNIDIVGVEAFINIRNYAIIGTDGNIYLHIEDLTYFGEAIDDNYTVTYDFTIEVP